jgi:hypothetical protein
VRTWTKFVKSNCLENGTKEKEYRIENERKNQYLKFEVLQDSKNLSLVMTVSISLKLNKLTSIFKGYLFRDFDSPIDSYSIDTSQIDKAISLFEFTKLDYSISIKQQSQEIEILLEFAEYSFMLMKSKFKIYHPKKFVKFDQVKIESYKLPTILSNRIYHFTKDFIICMALSRPLRKFREGNSKNSVNMLIWAKKDGKYKGDGFTYRIDVLKRVSPQHSFQVLDYDQNRVVVLADRNKPRIYELNRKRVLEKISGGAGTENSTKFGKSDFVLNFRGNLWSLSDKRFLPEEFIDEPDGGDKKNLEFWLIIGSMIAVGFGIFVLGGYAVKSRMQKFDRVRVTDLNHDDELRDSLINELL